MMEEFFEKKKKRIYQNFFIFIYGKIFSIIHIDSKGMKYRVKRNYSLRVSKKRKRENSAN